MKKYRTGKKLSVFSLAVVASVILQAAFLPGAVLAEDAADMTEQTEQAELCTDATEQTEPRSDALPETEDVSVEAGIEEAAVYPILIPVESGNPQYEQLSSFLALSADRFQIYMVTFADGEGKPAQPGGSAQVAVDIPSDYDMGRTVISEISLEGDSPQRVELSYTAADGKAVFQTDHDGLFVIMEKKVQPQLPPSLEMTDKVERLELDKYTGTAGYVIGNGSLSTVPKTGDQAAPFLWLGSSAAVSAGLLLIVIANSMKNSKKS